MALPAFVGWKHEVEDTWRNSAEPTVGLKVRGNVFLFIPIEATSMRTPFREEVLNYIYSSALRLSKGQLQSATVLALDYPDEESSLVLSLNLVLDGGWELVRQLEREIETLITERSKSWTETEWDDFCRNIHLYIVPTNL